MFNTKGNIFYPIIMEDVLTYALIFGLLILFTLVFLSNKEKNKKFLLTNKIYSFGNIDVFVVKQGKEIKYLEIHYKLFGNTSDNNASLSVETVAKDKTVRLTAIPEQIVDHLSINRMKINYHDFSKLIIDHTNQLQHFRIVVTFANNKKLKSGILAFNKNWNIYTPDTGIYN